MATIIKATKDLYHEDGTRSFTKGEEYIVLRDVYQQHELMEALTTNDQGEPHRISFWYSHFKILK